MRWRVERAGTSGRYYEGWFARSVDAQLGAWFPTHGEAIRFVDRQVRGIDALL